MFKFLEIEGVFYATWTEFTGITQPECFHNSDEWITRGSDALVGDAPSTDEAWVTELSVSNVE